jgi:hypothetical protein
MTNHNEPEEEYYLEIFLAYPEAADGDKIAEYIELQLSHEVSELVDDGKQAAFDAKNLEIVTDESSFAVIVIGANPTDDALRRMTYLIGFCQGKMGYENVLVLKPESVAALPAVDGVMYQAYSNDFAQTFGRIRKEIEAAVVRFDREQEENS